MENMARGNIMIHAGQRIVTLSVLPLMPRLLHDGSRDAGNHLQMNSLQHGMAFGIMKITLLGLDRNGTTQSLRRSQHIYPGPDFDVMVHAFQKSV